MRLPLAFTLKKATFFSKKKSINQLNQRELCFVRKKSLFYQKVNKVTFLGTFGDNVK